MGQVLDVTLFNAGELVDVIGTSKGKGFAGVVKRHHFAGGAHDTWTVRPREGARFHRLYLDSGRVCGRAFGAPGTWGASE